MAYFKTFKAAELSAGKMTRIEINKREILIAGIGGQFYAVDDRCGHMNGSLSMGRLEGKVVECPLHRARYDITSGKCVQLPQMGNLENMFIAASGKTRMVAAIDTLDLRTYRTRVEDGFVMVEIPDCDG